METTVQHLERNLTHRVHTHDIIHLLGNDDFGLEHTTSYNYLGMMT